jgi:hypothetical protein
MAIPASWSLTYGNVAGAAHDRRGVTVLERYRASAGTTLATARAALPMRSVHPAGGGGLFASRLQQVELTEGARDGRPLVAYHWLPPTLEEILEEHPDHVLVEVEADHTAYKPHKDAKGNYVWHRHYDQANEQALKWEPAKGQGIKMRPRMKFRTRLARPYDYVPLLRDITLTTNWGVMAQYNNCDGGTLLLTQWARRRAPTVAQLYIYDVLSVWDPRGWNNETHVQKYEYRVYEVKVRNADGTEIADRYRTVGDWYPSGDTYPAQFYEEGWWGILLGNFSW